LLSERSKEMQSSTQDFQEIQKQNLRNDVNQLIIIYLLNMSFQLLLLISSGIFASLIFCTFDAKRTVQRCKSDLERFSKTSSKRAFTSKSFHYTSFQHHPNRNRLETNSDSSYDLTARPLITPQPSKLPNLMNNERYSHLGKRNARTARSAPNLHQISAISQRLNSQSGMNVTQPPVSSHMTYMQNPHEGAEFREFDIVPLGAPSLGEKNNKINLSKRNMSQMESSGSSSNFNEQSPLIRPTHNIYSAITRTKRAPSMSDSNESRAKRNLAHSPILSLSDAVDFVSRCSPETAPKLPPRLNANTPPTPRPSSSTPPIKACFLKEVQKMKSGKRARSIEFFFI
jgi:hypothetical protein